MTFSATAASLSLLALFAAGAAPAQTQPASSAGALPAPTPLAAEPGVAAAVRAQFLEWQAGKVDQSAYAEEANRQFTPAIVAQVSAQLQPLGAPLKLTLLDRRVQDGVRSYIYAVDATKGKLHVFYAVDAAGKVVGIRFSPGSEDPKVTALARVQFEALREGAIDPSLYSAKVAAGMTPAVLAQVKQFLSTYGPPRGLVFFGTSHVGEFDVYVYKVDCERGAIRETISLDAQGKVGGIYVAPWDS